MEEKKKKKRRDLPVFLTEDERDALLEAAYEMPGRWGEAGPERNRAIVAVGVFCGLRVSELCDLNREDFNIKEQMVHVKHGKGDKERYVPLNSAVIEAVQDYLATRTDDSESLFTTRMGGRISRYQVYRVVTAIAEYAGIKKDKRISPHKLRHTFATSLMNKNVNISKVQHYLGHESIDTTQIYTHVTGSPEDVELLTSKPTPAAVNADPMMLDLLGRMMELQERQTSILERIENKLDE